MAEGNRYLLGVDLGTTAIKAALFEVDAGLVETASITYPTHRPRPGWVEQDAEEWFASLLALVDRLFARRDLGELVAIGICSQVNTHVFVDRAGRALAPAIVWQDDRTEAHALAVDGLITAEQRETWWKSAGAITASHTLARAAWMRSERPDVWEQTHMLLSPKDYLLRQLTGQWISDPLSSFDVVDAGGHYIEDLVALVPGLAKRLPALHGYAHIVGSASHPRFAGGHVLVVNGTMDAFGSIFGSGASEAGQGVYISGTCEIVALVADEPGGAPGVVSFMPVDGWYVHAGPTQSGGDTLRWIAALFDRPIETMLELAAQADRRAESPIFLPHLQGERAPLWDMWARGTFLGLTSSDGGPQAVLAALEGVAISARILFDAAQRAAGRRYEALYLGGSGNRSDLWAQIRADVLGVPLLRVKCLDLGPVGAAIMAGVGTGWFKDVASASRRFVEIERVFTPDPAMAPRYERMTRRYMQAYEALKPVYREG